MADMHHTLLPRAAAHAQSYLSSIHDRHVAATLDGDELRRRLGAPLLEAGTDPVQVIDQLADAAGQGTVATQGPRYFGFVIGGSLPSATAADWLVSAWDQNAGLYIQSPLVAVIEQIVSSWLIDLVGIAPAWSVGYVTGCQMANFTALAAARHHVLREVDWDVERDGLFGAPPIAVIVSAESHYTILNALRMLGFGAERLRRIETDHQGRMRADKLDEALRTGTGPCIICAQAGNVNTGAFDPLAQIAALAKRRGAWLHVDGAFGLWAAVSPSLRQLVAGIAQADSIATDAHKWLNVPYDSGIAMIAHAESHRRAFSLAAQYIQETQSERDPHQFTPEESRRARVVPIYAALRTLGRDGLREMIERCCTLARRMADALRRHPQVQILNQIVLNQVLVQFVPGTGAATEAADFTRRVVAAVQQDGTCWLGGTVWQGRTAMRISVSTGRRARAISTGRRRRFYGASTRYVLNGASFDELVFASLGSPAAQSSSADSSRCIGSPTWLAARPALYIQPNLHAETAAS
jgi:glutamate/tyrosine decarboxylase-like PLP-dependent enzyme